MTVRSQAALPQAGSQSHPASAPTRSFSSRTRPHRKQRLLLTVLLIPLPFTSLAAQDTPTAGDKVRVTIAGKSSRVVGFWVSSTETRLTLTTEDRDSSLVLPLASLTKLEVTRGQKSKWLTGALIGSFIKVDRWEEVPLTSLRVSLTPITPHGLGPTVRVRWSP